MFRGEDFAAVEREDIKGAVKKREIRLVVATDAACEGLNLQTLGTLINVDLPWNHHAWNNASAASNDSAKSGAQSTC